MDRIKYRVVDAAGTVIAEVSDRGKAESTIPAATAQGHVGLKVEQSTNGSDWGPVEESGGTENAQGGGARGR